MAARGLRRGKKGSGADLPAVADLVIYRDRDGELHKAFVTGQRWDGSLDLLYIVPISDGRSTASSYQVPVYAAPPAVKKRDREAWTAANT